MKRSLLITASTLALAIPATARAGLIAGWDFEGDFNDVVSNTAGTGFDTASATGTPISGVGSSSLSLSGNDGSTASTVDYVNTNTNGGLGGTGSFTIVATIQTTTSSNATIFNYGDGVTGGNSVRLLVQANGDLRVEMNQGAGFVLAGAGLNDGEAHKVAVIFDSTSGDSFLDVDLYVDGAVSSVTSGTDHTVNLGNHDLLIGRDQVSELNRPFVGLIDDVMIFDEALDASAIDVAVIPEPGSLALIGLGGLCLMKRRRRD